MRNLGSGSQPEMFKNKAECWPFFGYRASAFLTKNVLKTRRNARFVVWKSAILGPKWPQEAPSRGHLSHLGPPLDTSRISRPSWTSLCAILAPLWHFAVSPGPPLGPPCGTLRRHFGARCPAFGTFFSISVSTPLFWSNFDQNWMPLGHLKP